MHKSTLFMFTVHVHYILYMYIRPSKNKNMFSVPARFLFGGPHGFSNSKLYFKNRKMSAEPSENKVLASQKFQFYRLSVQLTQSPVHTNDPFGFFPATLCNCSSTNDRVTFVFLHEDPTGYVIFLSSLLHVVGEQTRPS